MISRLLVIVLAFGAAAFRASQGAWVEAGGLAALGAGLLILRMWPAQKRVAWIAFALTGAAMVAVLLRGR